MPKNNKTRKLKLTPLHYDALEKASEEANDRRRDGRTSDPDAIPAGIDLAQFVLETTKSLAVAKAQLKVAFAVLERASVLAEKGEAVNQQLEDGDADTIIARAQG